MTARVSTFCFTAFVLVSLSGCASAASTAVHTGGAIELAVSQTCADASDPECVVVNGESIANPAAYEQAGVEAATAATGEGQNAVDVTFDDAGTEVLRELTETAAAGGATSRLVIKIGGEIESAVIVMQPLEGNIVQINLSPDESAQDVATLIQGD